MILSLMSPLQIASLYHKVMTNDGNFHVFITSNKTLQKQMQFIFKLLVFRFQLIYYKEIFNFLGRFLRQLNYQKSAELKVSIK